MELYKCEICGKYHQVVKAIEIPIPEMIIDIPEAEKEKRIKEFQGSYIVDDRIYVLRGDIFIYKEDMVEPIFNWSVWISISLADFQSKAEELEKRINVEFKGQLETDLPFYEKTKGLEVKAFINLNYDYAVIKVEENSQLKSDQATKITRKRVIEIMQTVYHKT